MLFEFWLFSFKKLLLKRFLSFKCCFKKTTIKIQYWSSKLCKSYRSRLHWYKMLRFSSKCVPIYCVLVLCQFFSVLLHKINCRNLSSGLMRYFNFVKEGSPPVSHKIVEQWKSGICWVAVSEQVNKTGLNLSLVGKAVLVRLGEETGLETREAEGSVYLSGVQ